METTAYSDLPETLADEVRRVDRLWDSMSFQDRYLAIEGVISLFRTHSGRAKWGSEVDLSALFKSVIRGRVSQRGTHFWGTHHFTYMNALCRTDAEVRRICFHLIDDQKVTQATVNKILRHAKEASQRGAGTTRDIFVGMLQMIQEAHPDAKGLQGVWTEEMETSVRHRYGLKPLPKIGERRSQSRERKGKVRDLEPLSPQAKDVEEPIISSLTPSETQDQEVPEQAIPPEAVSVPLGEDPVREEPENDQVLLDALPKRSPRDLIALMRSTLEELLDVQLASVPESQKNFIRSGVKRTFRECLDYLRRSSDRFSRIEAETVFLEERGFRSQFESAYRSLMGVRPPSGPFLDIKRVKTLYREQAKSCHPDLHPNDNQAQARFDFITQKYTIIVHYYETCRAKQEPSDASQ